jgi:hypothetical protein
MTGDAATAELAALLSAFLGEAEGRVGRGTASQVVNTISLLAGPESDAAVVSKMVGHALRNK